jgi:hypothetical protein
LRFARFDVRIADIKRGDESTHLFGATTHEPRPFANDLARIFVSTRRELLGGEFATVLRQGRCSC